MDWLGRVDGSVIGWGDHLRLVPAVLGLLMMAVKLECMYETLTGGVEEGDVVGADEVLGHAYDRAAFFFFFLLYTRVHERSELSFSISMHTPACACTQTGRYARACLPAIIACVPVYLPTYLPTVPKYLSTHT